MQPSYTTTDWCAVLNSPDGEISRNNDSACETIAIPLLDTGPTGSAPDGKRSSILKSPFLWERSIATQLNETSDPAHIKLFYGLSSHLNTEYRWPGGIEASGWNCQLKAAPIEANVVCDNGDCIIDAMRKLPQAKPDFLIPWNDASIGGKYKDKQSKFEGLLDLISSCTGRTDWELMPVDRYIIGSDQPFNAEIGRVDWAEVDVDVLSARLSQIFNTAWIASQYNEHIPEKSVLNVADIDVSPAPRD